MIAAACGSSNDNGSGGGSGGKVDVVGYSTPETVYTDGLQPTFQKTPAGKGVSFSDSFGASGDQSRAVVAGHPASLVHFSQAGDMTKLVAAGIVDSNWDQNKYKGIAEDSVVVLVVRKGNPKGIRSFDDLINKDVSVALMLPCPIAVYTKDGKTFISTMRPSALADFYPDSGIQGIAAAVEKMVLEIVNEAK